ESLTTSLSNTTSQSLQGQFSFSDSAKNYGRNFYQNILKRLVRPHQSSVSLARPRISSTLATSIQVALLLIVLGDGERSSSSLHSPGLATSFISSVNGGHSYSLVLL